MSLIFQLVHHLTLSASLPRSRLRQLFCCLMACFTCVDVNEGLLSSLISGLVTLSSAYSCPMYSIKMLYSASFFKTHVVMFVHDPRCLGSLSTIRYPPHLFMHLPCYNMLFHPVLYFLTLLFQPVLFGYVDARFTCRLI